MGLHSFYSTRIFPLFYDCVMDKPHLESHRKNLLGRASGEVLEIGLGTGLNLPHYPSSVEKIVTVDPNPGMNRKAERRIAELAVPVETHILSSERLPFADEAFDCIVSTWTLCSIPDVESALEELYRVMRTGGRFLFIEHGLSRDPGVRRWQRRLNRFQMLFADGCRLDLDVNRLIASASFRIEGIDEFYMEKTPRTHGYMYRGIASK